MDNIGVFYLARLAEGFEVYERFAKSYLEHPAGRDHELVVIAKGFKRKTEFAALAQIFKGLPHQITTVDDDIGQDIQSYKTAAARYPYQLMCFMNTFTVLLADDWLKKLSTAMSSDVGMVGASGSFESIYNSWQAITRAHFHITRPGAYDSEIVKAFNWVMDVWSQPTLLASRSRYRRLRRWVGDMKRKRPPFTVETIEIHRAAFFNLLGKNGSSRHLDSFPYFPNPHIRSNVFLVRREDFLRMPLKKGTDKMNACLFESGQNGMSRRFLERGQKLLVVGANGKAYDIPEWPTCGGFRSGDQANLLATDNQTTAFDRMTVGDRQTHLTITWGAYLPGGRDSLLGVKFDALRPLSDFSNLSVKWKEPGPLLSIVIPTHNRRELVLDAIKTVTDQQYANWELAVFDNASSEPLASAIAALKDKRIRYGRSDPKLAVTDSWNSAIEMASGEYVTLIGDDDGLVPGYFERVADLIERFDRPDAIFSTLYQFFHPAVLPGHPLGMIRSLPTASFFCDRDYPFLLDKQERKKQVDGSLKVRRTFMFNMPAFTVRRDFLESLRRNGRILHPPFPDYYFANLIFEKAERLVADPRPLAFQGVSRPSFGFTLLNKKTEDGFKVLGHEVDRDDDPEAFKHLLPGPGYQTQYILTMSRVASEIADPARKPDFGRYRAIQIFGQLKEDGFPANWKGTTVGSQFWKTMTSTEKRWASKLVRLNAARSARAHRQLKAIERDLESSFYPTVQTLDQGSFVTGYDFYQGLRSGRVQPFRC
jgi:glycosyltransferase involved in cell wall biosynthesis